MNAITLKIYSGLHLGAEIELTEGTWTIGRDDSCDIIISDKALTARHVSITIDATGQVTFRKLDSTIQSVTGEELTETLLDPATLYSLNGVLFAWGRSDDVNSAFWREIEEKLTESRTKTIIVEKTVEKEVAPAKEEAPKTEENKEVPQDEKAESSALPEAEEETKTEEDTSESNSHKLLIAGVVAGILVLLGGSVFLYQKTKELAKPPVPKMTVAEAVHGAGFTDVVVTHAKNGLYVFSGSVKDDEQRGRLVKFSKMLDDQVAIAVTVDSDYTMPLESAFNTMDFWPSVTLTKSKTGMQLLVAGYMLSSVVEEQTFVKAEANVPLLTTQVSSAPLTVKRKIRYRQQVSDWIAKAFSETSISGAKVEYLPGRIRICSVQTPESREQLEKAVALIHKKSDVPLRIDLVNLAASKLPPKQLVAAASAVGDPMKPNFRVTAVSGGALKFVTLANGEKYFVGAPMPGGFVLESISIDRLVLTKNGRKINYPLRIQK